MGPEWRIEYAATIPSPSARVYTALTDAAELRLWFGEHADVHAVQGGEYAVWGRFTLGTPSRPNGTGRVVRAQPHEAFVVSWPFLGVPSSVEFALAPSGDSAACDVKVRHTLERSLPHTRAHSLVDDFWRYSFGNLSAYLAGGRGLFRIDFGAAPPELTFTLDIDAPPAIVFRALVDPASIARWIDGAQPTVEPRVGGAYRFGWRYEVDGRSVDGGPTQVLEFVQDRRLKVDWPDWRGEPGVPPQWVSWDLEPTPTGTRLTFTHGGFGRPMDVGDYGFGWTYFLDKLEAEARSLAAT